uniref:Uncharacterized protein n=1 Tax=Glossina palpalis gambiensis TaxID=67801 RepID=A0A1B0BK72_9MUSC
MKWLKRTRSVQFSNLRFQPPQKQSLGKQPLKSDNALWKEVKETCCSTLERYAKSLSKSGAMYSDNLEYSADNTKSILVRQLKTFFAAVVDDVDVLLNEVATYYKISEKIWLAMTLAPALFPSSSFESGTTPAVLEFKPTTAALLPALLTETAAVAAAGEKRGRLQIVVAVVLKAVLFLFVIVMADKLFAAVGDGDKKLASYIKEEDRKIEL